ncbi:MAG: hypothetical protein AB7H96_19255 [Vicinamibacterales bacterium]
MVIVLLGPTTEGAGHAAGVLARQLGWRAVEAHRPEDVRRVVEHALERRERMVVGWAAGTAPAARLLLDGLRPVRFVAFQPIGAHHDPDVPEVPPDTPAESLVSLVRAAFGA